MKLKKGKEIWAILIIIILLLIIIGTVGAFITKGNFDTYNLILIFLLTFSLSSVIEKKK